MVGRETRHGGGVRHGRVCTAAGRRAGARGDEAVERDDLEHLCGGGQRAAALTDDVDARRDVRDSGGLRRHEATDVLAASRGVRGRGSMDFPRMGIHSRMGRRSRRRRAGPLSSARPPQSAPVSPFSPSCCPSERAQSAHRLQYFCTGNLKWACNAQIPYLLFLLPLLPGCRRCRAAAAAAAAPVALVGLSFKQPDTDVGLLQRADIVRAIPAHHDRQAAVLERSNDDLLLHR